MIQKLIVDGILFHEKSKHFLPGKSFLFANFCEFMNCFVFVQKNGFLCFCWRIALSIHGIFIEINRNSPKTMGLKKWLLKYSS